MKIRHKITAGFAALIVIGAGYGVFATSSLRTLSKSIEEVASKPLTAVESARAAGSKFRAARDIARRSLSFTELVDTWDTLFAFERHYAEFRSELQLLKRLAISDANETLKELLEDSNAWHTEMLTLLGDAPATVIRPSYHMRTIEADIEQELDDLVQATVSAANTLQTTITEQTDLTEKLAGLALICSLALALLLAISLATQTIGPLRKLEVAMKRVARNDFDAEFEGVDSMDELGEMASALETFRDNAVERIRAEQDLRVSRERYKSLTEVGTDWNWECDAEGRFTFVSGGFERILGLSSEEIIGRSWLEISTGLDGDWDRHFAAVDAERTFRNFRYRRNKSEGPTCHFSLSGAPVYDASGAFEGYRGVGSDRTVETEAALALERQRQELESVNAKLSTEKKRLNLIYRNTPAMLHSILSDGTIVEVSDFWCKKLGYSRNEVIGRSIYDFMESESVERMQGEFISRLFEGKGVDNVDYIYVRKDGSLIDICLSAIAAPGAEKGEVQTFSVVFDVSDQKRAERELESHRDHLQELVEEATESLKQKAVELREALEKEKELNTLQRDFVSMASHEFRTPLAIIDASSQRIERKVEQNALTAEDLIPRVGKIRLAVARMSRLMESTLSAAKMEAGKIAVQAEPCDIAAILQEIVSREEEIAPRHRIRVYTEGLPDRIQADPGALDQIITNLLSNAVKYAADAPQIDVVAMRTGAFVTISVRDYGAGIDNEDLARVGERFFRGKASTGIEGTGIGLNLVGQLVAMHGGTLHADSQVGEGSTFAVSLPIAGPDEKAKDIKDVA